MFLQRLESFTDIAVQPTVFLCLPSAEFTPMNFEKCFVVRWHSSRFLALGWKISVVDETDEVRISGAVAACCCFCRTFLVHTFYSRLSTLAQSRNKVTYPRSRWFQLEYNGSESLQWQKKFCYKKIEKT